jgi:predicted SAM-dependent methyltransferase
MKRYFQRILSRLNDRKNRVILSFLGDTVKCELCGWSGLKFPEGKCPTCRSLPRTRLIPFSVEHFVLPKNSVALLHVAPNKPEYDYINGTFKNTQYDRMDILKRDHTNLVLDLTKTNLPSNSYDIIILWHVLEHIPQDTIAIKEMYRILKSDGKILMSVPIYPVGNQITFEDDKIDRSEYLKVHGHHDHCRSCGLDYYKRFENLGFKTSILKVDELPLEEQARFGLSKNHVSWLFEKA